MTKNHQYFSELVNNVEQAELSQMFGKPCGKIQKKAFVAFYQDEMVFKLGAKEVDLIKKKYLGAQNWDPSGKKRPMKDWVQIPTEYHDSWQSLTSKAADYLVNNL